MDVKVKEVQEWLISEYGSRIEFNLFVNDVNFSANGITDWKTMTALVYALQYELSIFSPNGSFGPMTLGRTETVNKSNSIYKAENIIRIIKGGFWCHGYNPGYDELHIFEDQTTVAINEFRGDIGIVQNGNMEGYVWKSLLTTDAFTTTWSGGSNALREVQQELNGTNLNGYPFSEYTEGYIPTDGLGSRQLSGALIIYVQALAGDTPDVVAPSLGPYTQGILRDNPLPETSNFGFVKLAGYMLRANGYNNAPINGVWDNILSSVVSTFQSDMAMSSTGNVDYSTWMAGLISYGDKDRSYTACDTRFEITESRISTLKNMGIKIVGRYITGGEFKGLRPNELFNIVDSGLGVIPIYQDDGTSNDDFSYNKGQVDAVKARRAAVEQSIPLHSIIYFAVDYDPIDIEITNYIIPYFQGIRTVLLEDNLYLAGIYGTRNVCSRVLDTVPEIVTAYVSNMSSGFSGNLGFKMPNNWNFNQFDEISIGNWGIDKVIYSGKHGFIESFENLPNYDESLFARFLIYSDDPFSQPKVYINLGEEVDVYTSKPYWLGSPRTTDKVIGKIKTGQFFTKIPKVSIYTDSRVIFTADNGKAAYGYVKDREYTSSSENPILSNIEEFHKFYYDEVSGSLERFPDLHTSSEPLEFTVKKPLEYFGQISSLGILPIGTKLYLYKELTPDGLYYTSSIAGRSYPQQMLFNKMKLPGQSIQDIDPSNPEGYGWVTLGYSFGSFGSKRAIY